MTPIKSNVITIIIAIVCITGLTSWYLIAMKSDQAGSSIELTKNIQPVSEETSSDSGHELQTDDRENTTIASTKPTAVISNLTLLAVVVANPAINSSAVIQFDSRSDNYAIGEIINGTDVLLDEVLVDSVIVTLEGKE